MRRETELELLRMFFKHRQARTTEMADEPHRNPATHYTSQERFAREWDALFWGQPLIVALSGDLPDTGDVVAIEVAGVPVLLVRGEDGEVSAFLNICRHRGSQLVQGRAHPGRVLTCPYHAWSYDLEGNLLGQPLSRGGFEGLDRSAFGLIPIQCAERYGVIAVRIGADAPVDLEEHLCGIGEELTGFDFGAMRFFAEQTGTWDMNWKQAVDTFTESYHVFSLHKETIAHDFLSVPGIGLAYGPHNLGGAMRRSITELLDREEDAWTLREHASLVYRIFPNVIFNLPKDGHVELWQIYPEDRSPNRTRISMKFYTPGDVESDKARRFWQTNFDLTVRVVFAEDFDAQAEIHRGLRTGLLPELVYGRNEPGLIQFHRSIEDALARTP